MERHFLVVVCLIVFVAAGAGVAGDGNWAKPGSAILMLGKGGGIVKVKAEVEVSMLMLRFSKEKVTVKGIEAVFGDDKEKALNEAVRLRPGTDSDAIDIGSTGVVAQIEIIAYGTGKGSSSLAPEKVFGA
jgi:hypothetical protein